MVLVLTWKLQIEGTFLLQILGESDRRITVLFHLGKSISDSGTGEVGEVGEVADVIGRVK